MTTGQKFATGIALLGGIILATSFYNSSGEDAVFYLSRSLGEEERKILELLGFWNYSQYDRYHRPGVVASISYRQF